MSKEFQGLEVPNIVRDSKNLEYWLPHIHHRELDRPITSLFLGVIPTEAGNFYPVEINLLKETQNNIFIVGNSASKKEELLKGALNYAGQRTAEGYLKVQAITGHTDPYQIAKMPWLKRHFGRNDITHAPEGIMPKYILSDILKELDKKPGFRFRNNDNPRFLVIDDLGYLLRRGQKDTMSMAMDIMKYKGKLPFMTISLVNDFDLDLLKQMGNIAPDNPESGIWFIGQSEAPDAGMEDFPPGYFLQWNSRKKRVGNTPITFFD